MLTLIAIISIPAVTGLLLLYGELHQHELKEGHAYSVSRLNEMRNDIKDIDTDSRRRHEDQDSVLQREMRLLDEGWGRELDQRLETERVRIRSLEKRLDKLIELTRLE